jgi:hypothetical protein
VPRCAEAVKLVPRTLPALMATCRGWHRPRSIVGHTAEHGHRIKSRLGQPWAPALTRPITPMVATTLDGKAKRLPDGFLWGFATGASFARVRVDQC